MRPGYFIKHRKFRDVCIQVHKIGYYGEKWKGKGTFVNLGFDSSWPMGIPAEIEISKEELKNWQWVDPKPHTNPCLRYETWNDF